MDNTGIKKWLNKANDETKAFEIIIGLLIIVAGISVRANFVSGSEYPMNDGGLFYTMTKELVENNFALPKKESKLRRLQDIPFHL